MRIGEFSRQSGEKIDTLRYYEKIGLLEPQRINKQRFYDENDLEQINLIRKLKKLNFKLAEIKLILELDRKIDEGIVSDELEIATLNECLALFKNNLAKIERKEEEIKEMKVIFFDIIDKITILKSTKEINI